MESAFYQQQVSQDLQLPCRAHREIFQSATDILHYKQCLGCFGLKAIILFLILNPSVLC